MLSTDERDWIEEVISSRKSQFHFDQARGYLVKRSESNTLTVLEGELATVQVRLFFWAEWRSVPNLEGPTSNYTERDYKFYCVDLS